MELTKQISPACRPELPQFYFVDIFIPTREQRKSHIFSSFTAGDLDNQATTASVIEAVDQLTK